MRKFRRKATSSVLGKGKDGHSSRFALGKEVAGDELGLHRGATTRVDEHSNGHQVGLVKRLLDQHLGFLKAESLAFSNPAPQGDDRHSALDINQSYT